MQLAPSSEFLSFIEGYPPLKAIGNTPVAEIDLGWDTGDARVVAKYEHLNPGGSIKDRPVLRMLVEAILKGDLTPDKTILDATSGNAGIAYAMIGAALGYKVALVMPENASEERKKRLLAHGAEIIYTDPMLGYDETLHEVKRRYESEPSRYYWCDQYSNQSNPQAHYDTTGEEILSQVPEVTHFVAGVGTGGTISGVGKRLKEHDPSIQVIGINPPEWPGVEGLKPLGEGHIIPATLDESVIDEMLPIDVDEARDVSMELSAKGLFAGQSSGAYVLGALKTAQKATFGTVVTIFNDIGERYFSTGMWG